jgi:hypothetical protein
MSVAPVVSDFAVTVPAFQNRGPDLRKRVRRSLGAVELAVMRGVKPSFDRKAAFVLDCNPMAERQVLGEKESAQLNVSFWQVVEE